MQFNDQDILTDLLLNIKALSVAYHNAVLEAANDDVRNTLIQLNNEEVNLQRQVFNLMRDRNWHQINTAENSSQAKENAEVNRHRLPY